MGCWSSPYTGRKPALTPEQAQQLRAKAAAGKPKSVLATEFGISRETFYSYLRKPLQCNRAHGRSRRRARRWVQHDRNRSVGETLFHASERGARPASAAGLTQTAAVRLPRRWFGIGLLRG
ncbi:helix-turn-helix domain-containing protein [Nocardia sp. NBC_01730]|uniref:helix-turn-helix domain-containing protein n=1 Tax=Nocardia sp. NBC_01730 TaxID=2975998 RepID=UPI003FA3B539|nr:helix-turn-helix domain-containing protein [Nocardia sp. NBC_01730]